MRAQLILKDGRTFRGRAPLGFGGSGEAVFSTSMIGYQETLTDPASAGQMVCATFPEQGIYGIHPNLNESTHPWATALLCRRLTATPDHVFAEGDLGSWLRRHRVALMTELDTRALTQHLRDAGAQPGIIWTEADGSLEAGIAAAAKLPNTWESALVQETSCSARYELPNPEARFRVAVLDGGTKDSLLKHLHAAGCHLEVFPWNTPASELSASRFQGLFLGNGPGDPAVLTGMQKEVAACIGKLPIFGVSLGHQLLALALGGQTHKLKFGHHGNQPVLDLSTNQVEITAQNHGFAVQESSLPAELEATHRHLSDNSMEGMRHRSLPIFSLQYYPGSGLDLSNPQHAYAKFVAMMEQHHA